MKTMWMVTMPTKDSELVDIMFSFDWVTLGYQYLGGLDGKTVVGVYHHERQARNVAQSLLDVRDGKLDPSMVKR